jgi:hypothetical protein
MQQKKYMDFDSLAKINIEGDGRHEIEVDDLRLIGTQ